MKSYRYSLFLFSLTLLATNVCTDLLNAQPSLIHLSLQSEAKPGTVAPVTVTWCSDNTGGKQFIRYGVTSYPGKKVKTVKSEYGGKTFYKADLNKLKPGTRYFYKSGSDKEGWSPVYSFNSEPDTGTFRVGIFGDTQNNENNKSFEKTRVITDLLKTYSPSLTLHMGDIVNDGSQTESWFDFLSVTEDLNAVSPLMPVLGNHDVQNSTGEDFQKPFRDFYSLFNLPGDEINYSFTYGKVRFIGIFSGCAQAASEIDQVKYKPGSAEHIWLDEELTKAENEKNISWIIVWMHYPVNSFGWSNIAKWKENILPLLEKHRVDICLAGHRHVYERHLQAKNGIMVKNKSRSTLNADDGTIFITNGTAGGDPTGPGGKDISTMAFTPDKTMYCFAVMDISNDSLTYSVFDHNNILVDRVIVNKQE